MFELKLHFGAVKTLRWEVEVGGTSPTQTDWGRLKLMVPTAGHRWITDQTGGRQRSKGPGENDDAVAPTTQGAISNNLKI